MISLVSEPVSMSDLLVLEVGVFAELSSTRLQTGEAEWIWKSLDVAYREDE
jgi:hypothetical protein